MEGPIDVFRCNFCLLHRLLHRLLSRTSEYLRWKNIGSPPRVSQFTAKKLCSSSFQKIYFSRFIPYLGERFVLNVIKQNEIFSFRLLFGKCLENGVLCLCTIFTFHDEITFYRFEVEGRNLLIMKNCSWDETVMIVKLLF